MSVDLIPLWSKSMDGPYDFVYTVKVTLHSTHRLTFHKKLKKNRNRWVRMTALRIMHNIFVRIHSRDLERPRGVPSGPTATSPGSNVEAPDWIGSRPVKYK